MRSNNTSRTPFSWVRWDLLFTVTKLTIAAGVTWLTITVSPYYSLALLFINILYVILTHNITSTLMQALEINSEFTILLDAIEFDYKHHNKDFHKSATIATVFIIDDVKNNGGVEYAKFKERVRQKRKAGVVQDSKETGEGETPSGRDKAGPGNSEGSTFH